jgi:hypothetical protein
MSPSHHLSVAAVVGIAIFLIFRIYRVARRSVGRQRLWRFRAWLWLTVFSLLALVLLMASLNRPLVAVSEIAGITSGVILAIYGLRHTSFERTPAGLYYTPHAHIGIALSVIFTGFIAYHAYQRFLSPPQDVGYELPFVRSPLTILLFGVIAGYYAWYSAGLLRWQRAVLKKSQSGSPLKDSEPS